MNDNIFKTMPELTEDQLGEINDCFIHYLFYRRIKKSVIGAAGVSHKEEYYECVCSHCGAEFSFPVGERHLSHKYETACPKCEFKVTARHMSYGKKSLSQSERVLVICPENESKVWLRAYYADKWFWDSGTDCLYPRTKLCEVARYLLRPRETAVCWAKEYSYKTERYEFCEQKTPREPFYSYMNNGGDYLILSMDKLDNTFLQYFDITAWNYCYTDYYESYRYYYGRINIPETRYLCEFAHYPIIESLIKAGFGELVAYKIAERRALTTLFNWEADKLSDLFKNMDKSEIKWLHDCDYQYISLKEYALFKRVYGKKDIERYQSDKEIFGMCFTELLQLIRRYKLRYTHSLNYLIAQNDKYRPTDRIKIRNEWSMLNIWSDYLRFAKELGYDMKNEIIIYPKELMKAHDKASKAITTLQKKQAIEKAKAVTAANEKKYTFEFDGLRIVIPTCPEDIIAEGKKLRHCVGGYSDRHFSGKLTILFIRSVQAPDKPYVTMEVRGKKIVQVHGYKNDINKPLSKSVKQFVEEFRKYIEHPIKYKKELEKARKTA